MKKILLAILVAANSLAINASNYTLKLNSGDVSIPIQNATTEIGTFKDVSNYVIVQFNQIPTTAEKEAVRLNGVELLEYLPHNAFIADIANAGTATLGSMNIRGVIPFIPTYKLSKAVKSMNIPPHALHGNQIDLMIEPHLNVDKNTFVNYLLLEGFQLLNENIYGDFFEVRVPQNKMNDIQNNVFVKSIDFTPSPPEKEDQEGRSLHRGNMLDSEHPMGRHLNGSGVSIAIADDAVIGPHIDTKGRVTSFSVQPNGTHGDMTTGIAMGAGNLNPDIRGMATHAFLYYYDIGGYPHIANAVSNLNNNGVVITSTSFSEGCNAGYTATTRNVDQQTRQNPELLHVFSAGNSSASTCGFNAYGAGTPWGTITGGRKQGKSTIATGNLNYIGSLVNSSSRGPAADGRIKPDICANGGSQLSTDANNTYQVGGGTSAASPGVAGIAAQIYQGYRELNNGNDPESGLIKAALLNTARDLGNRGPDFFFGWGRINGHRAMKLIEENRYLSSTVSQGGSNTHNITIPANVEELKFMVYWTDFEAATNASIALVNNIDFQVVTPLGDTVGTWLLDHTPNSVALSTPATRGIDNLNNMEQVELDSVAAGTYTLLVDGKAIPQGPQKYYVVWETRTDEIEVTYPSGGESFTPGTTETIRWDMTSASGLTIIEYSTDSGATWTVLSTTNGTVRYRDWNVPNTVTGDLLVRVSNSGRVGVSANPASIIGVPSNIRTGYRCPDSLELLWNSVPGATAYEISMLGATHMDSITTSSTNSVVLYNVDLSNDNWVSVKALGNGIVGKRALAVQLGTTVDMCPFAFDVSLDALVSPSNSFVANCGSTRLPVTVSITNGGDSALSNVPLRMDFGSTSYFDTITTTLASGATMNYTFNDSLDLSSITNSSLAVVSDFVGDQNESNDSLNLNIDVINTLFTLPYTEDFETFNACFTTSDCGGTVCNLRNGWFNAENGVDDDIDLRVDLGGTPSNGTGPTIDHNPGTATGRYLYSEASNGCNGATAVTISPCFDLSNTINPEFSFWYHMEGFSVGNLSVDVFSNGVWINNIVPQISGSQGNNWLLQTIDMTPYAGQIVNFRINVTTGTSWSSDIAIDDISFVDRATSIDENEIKPVLGIYPNPTSGEVTFRINNGSPADIEILDMRGKLIETFPMNSVNSTFNLEGYSKGLYFVRIRNTSIVEKLIVQ